MAISKSSIVNIVASIFFLAFTVVACYTHYVIQHLSLPIPTALSLFVLVLPVVHGFSSWFLTRPRNTSRFLALLTSSPSFDTGDENVGPTWSSHPKVKLRARMATPLTYGLVVVTTALATLSGTHLAPMDSLDCALREQWLALFRTKNAKQIRIIQDALQCCGFRSVYDMAWPFPRSNGGRTQRSTCVKTYERTTACFTGWRNEEQKMAGLLIMVCVGSWLCQIIITRGGPSLPSFLQRFLSRNSDNQSGEHETRLDIDAERSTPAIGFHGEVRYTDDLSEVSEEAERRQSTEDRKRVTIENPRATNVQEHHTLFPST